MSPARASGPLPRQRMRAEDRREAIVDAAAVEFARGGLHGTTTEAIARRAGISQPYLFRFFETKKDLFIAASRRGFARVQEAIGAAADDRPRGDVLAAMGEAYRGLLADRTFLLLQMQSYAACHDDDVRTAVREEFGALYRMVERRSGAPAEDVSRFFATGMLLNVAAAMDLPSLDQDWVRGCLGAKADTLPSPR